MTVASVMASRAVLWRLGGPAVALPIQFDWTLEAIPASEQSGQESVARVLEGFLLQGVGQHAGCRGYSSGDG